jgi:hypothetical protein
VRIIETTDPKSIDRIIKATNSQTQIPRVWLHATEDIHRKIERILGEHGMFYDRRKNYYKNKGKAATEIVTIPYLAQALAAILLQRPDDARGRPTTVAEKYYKRLFSDKHPNDLYPKCVKALRMTEQFLDESDLEKEHKSNILFHLAMYAVSSALKSTKPQRQRIADLDTALLTKEFLSACKEKIYVRYLEAGGDDKAAKGPALAEQVRNDLKSRFAPVKKAKPGGAALTS